MTVLIGGLVEHYQRIHRQPDEQILLELYLDPSIRKSMDCELVKDEWQDDYQQIKEVVMKIRGKYYKYFLYWSSEANFQYANMGCKEVTLTTKTIEVFE